jgi:hypothetical protein
MFSVLNFFDSMLSFALLHSGVHNRILSGRKLSYSVYGSTQTLAQFLDKIEPDI